ncbi:MAG: antibiotic transporter permease, partial [Segetibacter sp.]|nr:antibiotic transporter permease [Segetibacter sp.]
MWKNNLKTAWRNIANNKLFSAINIFGLATGLACCILMFLFVQHELSYDKFHANAKNLYR